MCYPSDMSDMEWSLINPLFLIKRRGPKVELESVRTKLNGLFYINRTGCQWRYLPVEYGNWHALHEQFRRWRDSGMIERVNATLNVDLRVLCGKEETPSLLILDTQSSKTVQKGGPGAMTGTRRCLAGRGV